MSEEFLSELDIRSMVAALAYVSGVALDLPSKRRIFLEKLAKLVDVDAWFWAVLGQREAGEMPTFSVMLKGGFREGQFAKYLKAQEHPDMAHFNAPILAELQRRGSLVTRLRQHLDPEDRFPKSDVYPLWKEADLAPLILSCRPTAEGEVNAVCLFRRFDRPLFSERENRITHILLSEVPWLYDDAWPEQPTQGLSELSPRLHTVTNLLIQGMPRKQMADQLDLSLHTINEYVKTIYQRFGVHSQSELINRFVQGDGGDQLAGSPKRDSA